MHSISNSSSCIIFNPVFVQHQSIPNEYIFYNLTILKRVKNWFDVVSSLSVCPLFFSLLIFVSFYSYLHFFSLSLSPTLCNNCNKYICLFLDNLWGFCTRFIIRVSKKKEEKEVFINLNIKKERNINIKTHCFLFGLQNRLKFLP